MKVISAVLLTVATGTLCDAFAPAPTSFTRGLHVPNHAVTAATSFTTTTTALSMAFESTEEVELDMEERMTKSIESVKKNLTTIRTGRANPSILDLVKVDYYGSPTPINQMASISVPNSQQLTISPFDKSVMGDIERAIVESDLGLNPNNDGDIIRINIPAITEDRRKELLKQCKSIGEDGKVSVRNVRRDGVDSVKKMEKAGDIGEDESKGSQDDIQKLTDKSVKEIDSIVKNKEKDVMTV
mmetsp:Transcript_14371/g.21104  ORF Transcript_14371/g.21104 Transcript_14371/m.21104 type:complete len:242 (-) Transcript_14371:479-1204(-)